MRGFAPHSLFKLCAWAIGLSERIATICNSVILLLAGGPAAILCYYYSTAFAVVNHTGKRKGLSH